ncbi:esterase/lipase family protein [Fodinicola feengrottensis]|uniref:esterase/lipase family protein n=1 Tax=Fodinicola feengrottensis TaxID=435914 RepID=UPI002441BB61|nr:alpha/beta fold hydrolase [Fodinicola feengrottensis]
MVRTSGAGTDGGPRAGLGVGAVAAAARAAQAATGGNNDFSCRPSAAHPDPVVLLHGTFATYYEDLNFFQADLASKGYCTFSLTYGAYPQFPLVGGLAPIAQSAVEIKNYIEQVRANTGAAKVDIVGHSEGGLQSLYVTKMEGISSHINRVVALAPPTKGATASGLLTLAEKILPGGKAEFDQIVKTLGMPVFADELTGGSAVVALNDGPVAQPGVKYTILTSRTDELVTPTENSFVREPGVTNWYVQDFCPFDPVGHIGEAYDLNVWHLIDNALDPANATPIAVCVLGSPG